MGLNLEDPSLSYSGQASCAQLYDDQLMTEAQLRQVHRCDHEEAARGHSKSLCPLGFFLYDGNCYKASPDKETFSGAEMSCLSGEESLHDSRLAFTEDRLLLDFLSRLVRDKSGGGWSNFWVGLDRRGSGGGVTWTTRQEEVSRRTQF